MTDKRQNERVTMLGRVTGEITVVESIAVTEISLGGLTIETRLPLSIDSLHELRLMLGNRSVVVRGRVVHAHVADMDRDAVGYCSGLEFVEPPAHVRAAIEEFLESVKTARRPTSP